MKNRPGRRIADSLRRLTLGLALLALIGIGPAGAASLTIGLDVTPTSMDPHYHYVSQNTSPLSHIFEPLVAMDGDRGLHPALATSWRNPDDTTWIFSLRHGVKFHDGSDFTADDVLFSLRRVPLVPNSPSSFAIYTRNIASMQAIDPYTVEIKTKTPDAEFAIGLSQILIMSHTAAAGPAPEGKTTQQLNSGDGVVGTGPYKFVSFVSNDRMELVANPAYWGGAPAWDKVTLKVITNNASRAAAVLSGDIDAAHVAGDSLGSLRASKKISVEVGDSCFFTYLALDEHTPSPGISGTDGRNPLTDARVRKALSLAINRQAIADHVLSGLGEAAAELGSPSLFGASPDARPDPYDPAAAKKLLAAAGYPDGFTITLGSPTQLFPNDTDMAQAIAAMWTRIGVHTKVNAMVGSVFYATRNKLQLSAYHTFFCDYNGQMSYPLHLLSMTRDLAKGNGQVNVSGFSDPALDALLTKAQSTLNDDARRKLVQQASNIVMQQQHQVLAIDRLRYAYAFRRGLRFRPRLDTFLTAMQFSPVK